MPWRGEEDVPQGLKPAILAVFCGTAEAVPFQSRDCGPSKLGPCYKALSVRTFSANCDVVSFQSRIYATSCKD